MTVSVIFQSGAKSSTSNTQPASGSIEEKHAFLLLSIGCVSVRPLLISSHQRRNQEILTGYSQSRNGQFSNSSDWLIVFLRFIGRVNSSLFSPHFFLQADWPTGFLPRPQAFCCSGNLGGLLLCRWHRLHKHTLILIRQGL